MSCILKIEGEKFEIDRFIKESGLIPYNKYKTGEKIGFVRKGKDKYETNGCKIEISENSFDQFDKMKKETILFLEKYNYILKNVYKYGLKSDEIPVIDIGINYDSNSYPVQSDYLQPELMKLLGNLNLALIITHYEKSTFDKYDD